MGSSNIYISASLYTARAKQIRAFCPPDKLDPPGETSEYSFAGNNFKSSES